MADNFSVLDFAGATKIKAATDEGGGILADRLGAGESHIGEIGGNSLVASVAIVRPANVTPYASGQLVSFNIAAATINAGPTALALARKVGGTGVIRRVRLDTNHTGLAGTEVFRVHLFRLAPTVINGDGAALSVNGVTSLTLGYIDVTMSCLYNDGSKGFAATDIVFNAGVGSQNIYVLLEARGVYTPTSGETLNLTLEVLRD